MSEALVIRLNPRTVLRCLLWCVAILLVLHVISWYPVVVHGRDYPITFFNMGHERNFPTLFSTFLLALSAACVAVIAVAEKENRSMFIFWLFISFSFLCLAIDETVMIHEYVDAKLSARIQTTGLFRFAWVIPYTAMFVVFLLVCFRFYLRLPKKTKYLLAISTVIYVGGALGLEMVGGARYSVAGFDPVFSVVNSVEEVMEFIGCSFFVYTFMSYLDEQHPKLSIQVASKR